MSHGPRVAVLYNAPTLPAGHPEAGSEADVVAVAMDLVASLRSSGFDARPLPARSPVSGLVADLEESRPDLVFNLVEGFAGMSRAEAYLTGLLELLAIPYTGCPPESQALCHQKGRTKALLVGLGLPTAPFVIVEDDATPPLPFDGPYFVKPDAEDASLGIDQGSVIAREAEVWPRVASLRDRYGPVLIEAYLPGPEYNVGVLGLPEPEAFPVAEVAYVPTPGAWPILTYDAKWDVGSSADLISPIRCPAAVGDGLARSLRSLAVAAFRATGCRDVARVDFRLDPAGSPCILEVNPNPDLGRGAGWSRALKASGRDHDATMAGLARQALDRGASHG